MSGGRSGPGWQTPERDRAPVKGPRIAAVLVGAFVVFGTFVWITWRQLEGLQKHLEPTGPSEPAALGRPEINLLNTGLMELDTRASEERSARLSQLHGEGWVDRDAGVVHVPIEQGIERVVARQRRDGGER